MPTNNEKPASQDLDNYLLSALLELLQQSQSEDQAGNDKALVEKSWALLDQAIDANHAKIKSILEAQNLILLTPEFEAVKDELELASSRLREAQLQMGRQMATLSGISEEDSAMFEAIEKALIAIDFSHKAQDIAANKLQAIIGKKIGRMNQNL